MGDIGLREDEHRPMKQDGRVWDVLVVGGRFGIYAIGNAEADEKGSALFKSIKVRH